MSADGPTKTVVACWCFIGLAKWREQTFQTVISISGNSSLSLLLQFVAEVNAAEILQVLRDPSVCVMELFS